jgi:hypothetical protein
LYGQGGNLETERFDKGSDYTLFWDQVLAQTDEADNDYNDMQDRRIASFDDYLTSLTTPF